MHAGIDWRHSGAWGGIQFVIHDIHVLLWRSKHRDLFPSSKYTSDLDSWLRPDSNIFIKVTNLLDRSTSGLRRKCYTFSGVVHFASAGCKRLGQEYVKQGVIPNDTDISPGQIMVLNSSHETVALTPDNTIERFHIVTRHEMAKASPQRPPAVPETLLRDHRRSSESTVVLFSR